MSRYQERRDVATRLLVIYDVWHDVCMRNYQHDAAKAASKRLLDEAAKYRHLGIPASEDAIGRWIARTLGRKWTCDKGVM